MTENKDSARSAERLTGKQRVLRGLKYFFWVFGAAFVPNMVFWLCTAGAWAIENFWGRMAAMAAICCLTFALLAGLVVMAFGRVRRWHRFAAGAVVIAVCVLWVQTIWSPMECYCPWNPAIDTRFAPGFSEEAFSSVRPGMAEAEVVALLGEPFWKQDVKDGDGGAYDLWYYSGDGNCERGDYAWLGREIAIRDGVVLEVRRLVHYD
jgi:hypothetical protein